MPSNSSSYVSFEPKGKTVQKFLVTIDNGMQLEVSRAKYYEVHGSKPHNPIHGEHLQKTTQLETPAPFPITNEHAPIHSGPESLYSN